jgi:hypothetical protein
VAASLHPWQDGLHQQCWALREVHQLVQVRLPRQVLDPYLRLRPGRVDDEHINRTESLAHSIDQAGHMPLVGDVGGERISYATVATDGIDHLAGRFRP